MYMGPVITVTCQRKEDICARIYAVPAASFLLKIWLWCTSEIKKKKEEEKTEEFETARLWSKRSYPITVRLGQKRLMNSSSARYSSNSACVEFSASLTKLNLEDRRLKSMQNCLAPRSASHKTSSRVWLWSSSTTCQLHQWRDCSEPPQQCRKWGGGQLKMLLKWRLKRMWSRSCVRLFWDSPLKPWFGYMLQTQFHPINEASFGMRQIRLTEPAQRILGEWCNQNNGICT